MKTIVIMGNGPSLKDVDFDRIKNIDTFGLNMAYRKYKSINFYPKYYGSFDYTIIDRNKEEFQKLIDESPIERFFFARNYFKGEGFQYCRITNTHTTYKNPIATDFNNFYYQGNSGTMACQVAIMLGYKKIILLGVDQNYTERIKGSEYIGNGHSVIKDDNIENENYWFNDYQKKGDVYANPQKDIYHTPAWNSLPLKVKDIDIVNCSPISTLNCFRKSNIENEI